MKKNGVFLVPILVIGGFMLISNRLMSSGALNPSSMVVIGVVAFVLMMRIRPKKPAGQASADTTLSLLSDFSKDAFSYDDRLSRQFQSAVTDLLNTMPKAAAKKLESLQSQCKTDEDIYNAIEAHKAHGTVLSLSVTDDHGYHSRCKNKGGDYLDHQFESIGLAHHHHDTYRYGCQSSERAVELVFITECNHILCVLKPLWLNLQKY